MRKIYIITTDGETYPIDDLAEFESVNHHSSNSSAGSYSFTSNGLRISFNTISHKSVQSVKLEIPLDRASEDYFCAYMFVGCSKLEKGNVALTFPFEASNAFMNTQFTPTSAEAGSTYYIKGNSEVDAIPTIIADEAELISTEYYDLDGKKISTPQHGMNIIVESYSNGTKKSTKMLQK